MCKTQKAEMCINLILTIYLILISKVFVLCASSVISIGLGMHPMCVA